MSKEFTKISVVGLGYVGLPLSLQFARSGLSVLGLDLDSSKVEAINSGQSYLQHFSSKSIAEQVQKKWDQEFKDRINVVLGDEWIAGNLSYHLKTRPVWDGKVDKSKLDSYNKYICLEEVCLGVK